MKDPTLACTRHWKAQGRGNRAANVRSLLGCEMAVDVIKVRVADLIGRPNCGPTTVTEVEAHIDLVQCRRRPEDREQRLHPTAIRTRLSGSPVPRNPGV
jgi:hypothetical protein